MDATRKLRFLHLKPRESQNVPPQAEVLYKASVSSRFAPLAEMTSSHYITAGAG
jgi:hypothetical protein